MLALGGAAGIALDGVFGGAAVDTWALVVGVAHAGGGQFGPYGLERGAQFGGQPATQLRHVVGALFAQGEAAAPGAVSVGVGAIGVDAVGELVGEPGQLFGADLRPVAGQVGFGTFAGGRIDPAGQSVVEVADRRNVAGAQLALLLAGRGARQDRWEGPAGQPMARPEVDSFADTPGRFSTRDERPFGDRVVQSAAQLFGGGLAGQLVDQWMLDSRQPAAHPLAALQERQASRVVSASSSHSRTPSTAASNASKAAVIASRSTTLVETTPTN